LQVLQRPVLQLWGSVMPTAKAASTKEAPEVEVNSRPLLSLTTGTCVYSTLLLMGDVVIAPAVFAEKRPAAKTSTKATAAKKHFLAASDDAYSS
jgi:hypothetical protein